MITLSCCCFFVAVKPFSWVDNDLHVDPSKVGETMSSFHTFYVSE